MTLISRLRAVLLVLVLLPLLTVATTPGAVSAQAAPRYVQLISLKCHVAEEYPFADEPYIRIGGVTVWSGSLSEGQVANLTWVPARQFTNQVPIDLYDDDWPDSDDWLGTNTAFSTSAGLGYLTVPFTQNGVYYTLTYEIR